MAEDLTRRLKIYINGQEIDATLTNLRKNLAKFRNAANSAVEGTPDWKKYNEEVARTELELKAAYQAQKQFKEETVLSDKGLSNMQKNLKSTGGLFSGLKKTLGDVFFPVSGAILFTDALKSGIRYVKEFIGDAVQLSIESKGVEFAFQRLGDTGETAFLKVKAATRGLLSDLEIKRSLVEFDNFNISLEESATLFEFLTIRAQQTGQSMDYLKQSMVEGLSKESKLRIDNLGISAAKLNEELKKTPNFVQAVANIAKTEIARAGNILDEATNSNQRWNATLENSKLRIGNLINNSGVIPFFQNIGTAILTAVTPAESLTKQFQDQQSAFIDLQATLPPLIDEYDKLKGKSNLTADEQDRLKTIITQIGEIAPGVITKFDDYGNALDISSDKGRNFIETQKAILAFQNQDALKETRKQLADYQEELRRKEQALRFQTTRSSDTDYDKQVISKNIVKLSAEVSKFKQLEIGALETLDQLSGDYLTKEIERRKKAAEEKSKLPPPVTPLTDEEKAAREQAKTEAEAKKEAFKKAEEEISKIILETQERQRLAKLTGLEQELATIDSNYANKIEKFKGHDSKIKELEALRDQEKADLTLQREEELKQRLKEFEDQNRLESEAQRLEREALAAETDEQKTLLLLERTQFIANEQLRIEEEKELARLALAGATEEEINAIKTQFLLKRQQIETTYNNGKKAADKQALENEKTLTAQRVQVYSDMFGAVATLLGKNTAAGKAAGIAQATMNTYQGVTEVWSTKSILPEPLATISRIASTVTVLASGLAAVKQISATKTPSRAQGGETFPGTYSGGIDGIGGQPAILHPNEYVIPAFVRKDPEVPRIIEYLEAKRTGAPQSFAEGGNGPTSNTNDAVMGILAQAVNQLVEKGVKAYINYGISDEMARQEIEDKLTATKLASKN